MTLTRALGQSARRGLPDGTRVAVGHEEQRRATRSDRLAAGTLACARCDAPVAIGSGRRSLADYLTCPFCRHHAAVRDFLSLASPTRPVRVVVRAGYRP
ncbi:MAG: hypothetical protein ACR2JH_02725 [Solirubrobacteraceae bacterium]